MVQDGSNWEHCSTVPLFQLGAAPIVLILPQMLPRLQGSLFSGPTLCICIRVQVEHYHNFPNFPQPCNWCNLLKEKMTGHGIHKLFLPWNLPSTQSHTMLIEFHTDPLRALGQASLGGRDADLCSSGPWSGISSHCSKQCTIMKLESHCREKH